MRMNRLAMPELVPMRQWRLPIERFFLCAGPCSAESPEQLLATARGLACCPVSVFRAGIWKPRTHPGTFEGHGIRALPWLQRLKQETHLAVAVEVAEPDHVAAWNSLGMALARWRLEQNGPDDCLQKAEQAFRRALSADPDYQPARDNLEKLLKVTRPDAQGPPQ